MSEVVITDSTVLIYLAKLGDLDYLDELFEEGYLSETVYEETVTRGQAEQYTDALQIEQATEQLLDVRSLEPEVEVRANEIQSSSGLERGECTAIALAEDEGARCLTDDHAARKTAESLDIDVGGTLYVLLEALDDGRIGFQEYADKLDELIEKDFRMSASLYRKAVEAGEDLVD